MKLKELIIASRSFRSFDGQVKISRELLADWVDHARLSPSSINLQMLKFRVVYKKEERDAVLPLTRWAGRITDQVIPPVGHAPVAYIVVCADTKVTNAAASFQKDVGICAQSIMLAAAEAGFGGCMLGSFSPDGIREVLSLPSHLIPQLVLALGKPDETVTIVPPADDGSVVYFREGGVHYVQKRELKDLIIE